MPRQTRAVTLIETTWQLSNVAVVVTVVRVRNCIAVLVCRSPATASWINCPVRGHPHFGEPSDETLRYEKR